MPVALLATLDTKGREIAFLAARLQEWNRAALLIDVGLYEPQGAVPDVSRFEVALAGGAQVEDLLRGRRDEAMTAMGRGAGEVLQRLHREGRLEGVLGLGGNQGSAIVSAALRALPLGIPKLLVSTVASGNMRPFIGASDMAVMFSAADLLGGPNPVIEPVLRNAAAAMAGMTAATNRVAAPGPPLVAITAMGNTHPAVTRAIDLLRSAGLETAAFHASGACGSAMERLIRAGRVAAVLELTPHELTEEVLGVGAYQPVEPGRLTAAGEMGIPQVVAPGSMEYLCFGPLESVPPRLRRRPMYFHNRANVNLQVSRAESEAVGRVLAERLNQARGPVAVLLPMQGWSMYGAPGGPLHNPAVNAALVRSLTRYLRPDIPVQRLPMNINDPAFAEHCCQVLQEFLQRQNAAAGR